MNSIAKALETAAKKFVGGNVEDVIAFQHPYGCSQMGDDQENTRKVLADMIHHPNAGGVLVLGLGCENSNIPVLMDYIGAYDEQRVKFLQCQDVEDEMEEAMKRKLTMAKHRLALAGGRLHWLSPLERLAAALASLQMRTAAGLNMQRM